MSGALLRGSCKPGDRGDGAAMYVVSVAGSAGAFEPLRQLLADLPADLPAAVIAMLHTGPGSALAPALASRSSLPVRSARSGDLLRPGHVYVAPAAAHVIVNPDARLEVSCTAKRGCFRPSADWLFESAAASFGARHVAVVLSGLLYDGSGSVRMVKHAGGTVLVQCPADARFPHMPSAAILTGAADRVLPVARMARTIGELLASRDVVSDRMGWEAPFGAVV